MLVPGLLNIHSGRDFKNCLSVFLSVLFSVTSVIKAAQVILRFLPFQPTFPWWLNLCHQTAFSKSWNTCSGVHRWHCHLDGAKMYFTNFPVALFISNSIEKQPLVRIQTPLLEKAHKTNLGYMQNICTLYSVMAINLHYVSLNTSIYLHCLVHLCTLENSLGKRHSHAVQQ